MRKIRKTGVHKMKPVKFADFTKEIERKGFTFVRQAGSHAIYKNTAGISLSIPKTREIAPGTLRNLTKLIG